MNEMLTLLLDGKVPTRNDIEKSSSCVNAREVSMELLVKPQDWPQFVMPVTFEPGQEGKFEMTAYSTVPLKWFAFTTN